MRKSDIGLIITICLMPITVTVVLIDYYEEQELILAEAKQVAENWRGMPVTDKNCHIAYDKQFELRFDEDVSNEQREIMNAGISEFLEDCQ